MDEFCKDFKGGYCSRVDKTVPRSWCYNVCKGHWDGKSINTPETTTKQRLPYKQISTKDRVKSFLSAMKRWHDRGHEIEWDKDKLTEMAVCCTTCRGSQNGRCPYCGCGLTAKKRIEKGCPNKEDYPNLKKYPPKNYWSVCCEKTSVIIPTKNDPYLNRTIKSLLENATGDVEIIVVLDGTVQEVDTSDDRVKVIKIAEHAGRAVCANAAAAEAEGEYLLFIDAHCTMSYGWDTKLKCTCSENDIAISTILSLDAETFEPKRGRYTYSYLNPDLKVEWGGKYRIRKTDSPVISEAMSFTGCGWMIRKSRFFELGGWDEDLGKYGHTGPLWTLKTALDDKPGRVLLRSDVECGHVFDTNRGGRLFEVNHISQGEFKTAMFARYGNGIVDWAERFAPVIGWDFGSSKHRMVTVVRAFDGSPKQSITDYCFSVLSKCAENMQIITVKKPEKTRRSLTSMYSQLLEAAESTTAEHIYVAEQDCLYHPSRFEFVPLRDDIFYYQAKIIRMTERGFFIRDDRPLFSTLIANRLLFIDALNERITALNSGWRCRRSELGFEDPETQYKVAYYDAEMSIDIRHGRNFTGTRMARHYLKEVPYWGEYTSLRKEIGLDG